MLYGLCLKYLGNEQDAQDAVMDLFEYLNEKISNYEITNFHSWLYTVAKNHCLLTIRKEKQVYFEDINEAIMENGDFFTLLDEEVERRKIGIRILYDGIGRRATYKY